MRDTVTDQVIARRGFFPLVSGGHVRVEQGGGALFIAKHNLNVSRGGGQWLIAGCDQTIERGGGAVLISRQARVTDGFVGLLVAGRATLEGNARALVTLPASIGTAVAAAAMFGLGVFVGRHRKRRKADAHRAQAL